MAEGGAGGPAEAVVLLQARGRLAAGHFLHGLRGEVTLAVQFAAVEHHLTELRDVGCGGEEAAGGHRVTAGAVERVAELADAVRLQTGLGGVGFVRGGEAFDLCSVGPEGRVLHAEGLEEARVHEGFVALAGEDFDEAGGGVDAGVRVSVFRARLEDERGLGVARHGVTEREGVEGGLLGGGLEGQAAGVAEDFADGDGVGGGFEDRLAVGAFAGVELLALELGQVFLHGVVEVQLALVHEHHHGGPGDGLGLRGNPEDGVGLHHALRGAVGEPDGLDGEHLVLRGDERDGSGQFALLDEGF